MKSLPEAGTLCSNNHWIFLEGMKRLIDFTPFSHAGLIAVFITYGSSSYSADMYPDPIPLSGLIVEIETIATIPDAAHNVLPRPIVMTQDPSGRLFVNDLSGPIYYVDDKANGIGKYLDLRDYPALKIVSGFHGLQSFAFHPNFNKPGEAGYGCFYVLFSSQQTETAPDFSSGSGTTFHTVLLEWRTNDSSSTTFLPASLGNPYRELLRINQPHGGHVGGLISFNPTVTDTDPDYANLYVAFGDGAPGGGVPDPLKNGQNPETPYGAILRINPLGSDSRNGRYGIVIENAFASDNDPDTLAEIYCYGFRNPQRFSWDLATGKLYIADVGHNTREEINVAANGSNFGWDVLEGSHQLKDEDLSGLVYPVAEYDHVNFVTNPQPAINSRAITIGEVGRGICVPGLEGQLLISDFPTGILFTLEVKTLPPDGGNGGQSGFFELRVHDGDGTPRRFLELINKARIKRGLPATNRADSRFSVNTPGRIFLINKQDGVIRKIKRVTEPNSSIHDSGNQPVSVSFSGILQYSHDLTSWTTMIPQPENPMFFDTSLVPIFFRSISP